MSPTGAIERAAALVASSTRIAVLTGAGISKESGIATFRDAQEGLWATFDPEALASREGFRRDPTLVWQWYAWRAQRIASVEPNPGHFALAALGRLRPTTIITQNVDGLHQRAGSEGVLELHGSITRVKCFARGHPMEATWELDAPPPCPRCGSPGRPDVVWFGESLPGDVLDAAYGAIFAADLMLVVGTSALVQPAASLPLLAARRGAATIEVNPEETALTGSMTLSLRGPSGVLLPQILEALPDA